MKVNSNNTFKVLLFLITSFETILFFKELISRRKHGFWFIKQSKNAPHLLRYHPEVYGHCNSMIVGCWELRLMCMSLYTSSIPGST